MPFDNFRIGHGYDVHRLVKGRNLILGGIKIANGTGLLGHSDADVLIHAIIDSILGATALGDIGTFFPDSNQNYKNSNSLCLLNKVIDVVFRKNYVIVNIDSIILAQKPKLSPFIPNMRKNIAKVCKIEEEKVSVKAKTEENLGFTGNGSGIAAHAVSLIRKGSQS
ncbi:MAG: 2-C-methyl-D-erythritol 2,4-cyclodiphosphate synthase [Oscillospiraceae bacterium]|nr:2-C-methyl-D-erythritol 2,4-cyclodiphosphate synthase [Oscillospiraceae bacterium]